MRKWLSDRRASPTGCRNPSRRRRQLSIPVRHQVRHTSSWQIPFICSAKTGPSTPLVRGAAAQVLSGATRDYAKWSSLKYDFWMDWRDWHRWLRPPSRGATRVKPGLAACGPPARVSVLIEYLGAPYRRTMGRRGRDSAQLERFPAWRFHTRGGEGRATTNCLNLPRKD